MLDSFSVNELADALALNAGVVGDNVEVGDVELQIHDDIVAVTLIGRIITVIVVLYGIVTAAMVPGVALTYYLEYVKAKENETTSRFLEQLENLPNLSHEELEQLSKKIKEIKN